MLEQINLEIEALLKDYTHPDSIYKKIDGTKTMLENARHELKKLEGIMEKEQLDVEKMSQTSLKTLFYKCLGTHDKQVAKEKEEALAAVLKYEGCKKSVDELMDKLSQLTNRHYEMSKVQDKLDALYEEKRRVMASFNMPEYAKIGQLEKEISFIRREIKELKEAITPGNMAINTLNEAIELLDSAGDWGTWDLLGGGLIADMMKHDKIDKAKQAILNAQTYVQRLQVELQDVNMSLDGSIQITGGAVFADFFFDGLIADWYMQSKISQSRENVVATCGKIRKIVSTLSTQLNHKEKDLEAKEREIKRIIEQA
ncbi:MAG: hypothetical protein ACLSH8_06615 [Zhenhengia sp.]|uniref:hypothetical protein n=1 Tax=Zhenhengia sp. TaxID=2944208 RepID=UPI003991E699